MRSRPSQHVGNPQGCGDLCCHTTEGNVKQIWTGGQLSRSALKVSSQGQLSRWLSRSRLKVKHHKVKRAVYFAQMWSLTECCACLRTHEHREAIETSNSQPRLVCTSPQVSSAIALLLALGLLLDPFLRTCRPIGRRKSRLPLSLPLAGPGCRRGG